MTNTISIRAVKADDLKIFFMQECDPAANRMTAYPAKDERSFISHS